MHPIIPIWLAITFVAFGLYVLSWSAGRFVLRNPRSSGTISRPCGIIWLAAFLAYLVLLIRQEAFMAR